MLVDSSNSLTEMSGQYIWTKQALDFLINETYFNVFDTIVAPNKAIHFMN